MHREPKLGMGLDGAIGARMRAYRTAAGVTQTELAAALGLTPQQIQKYETGSNRISASRLLQIAEALRVTPAHLIDDGSVRTEETLHLAADGDEAELLRLFRGVRSRVLRRRVVEFARSLAGRPDPDAPA